MQMNLFPGPGSRPSPLIRCHMGDMTSPQIAAEAANIDSLEPQNLAGLLIFSTLCKVGRLSSMVSDKTLHIPLTLFPKQHPSPRQTRLDQMFVHLPLCLEGRVMKENSQTYNYNDFKSSDISLSGYLYPSFPPNAP